MISDRTVRRQAITLERQRQGNKLNGEAAARGSEFSTPGGAARKTAAVERPARAANGIFRLVPRRPLKTAEKARRNHKSYAWFA
jgi:hypothetical protein